MTDASPSAPGSVWGALREQHREVTENTDPLYLEDPVHPGVVFRYRYVAFRGTTKANKRLAKIKDRTEQTLESAIESLLLSLDEIMIAHPTGIVPKGQHERVLYPKPLKSLAEDGEPPLRFDERLCAGMGFPEGTSHSAKRIVFEWFARKDWLILQQADEIGEFFTEASTDVREEFSEALGKA